MSLDDEWLRKTLAHAGRMGRLERDERMNKFAVLIMQCSKCDPGADDYFVYGPFTLSEAEKFSHEHKAVVSQEKAYCGETFADCDITRIFKLRQDIHDLAGREGRPPGGTARM